MQWTTSSCSLLASFSIGIRGLYIRSVESDIFDSTILATRISLKNTAIQTEPVCPCIRSFHIVIMIEMFLKNAGYWPHQAVLRPFCVFADDSLSLPSVQSIVR